MIEELDLPFQDEGTAFLAAKTRGGNFDDPGCGKSKQAIRALDANSLKRGLIVCPAGARQVWPDEFKQWGRQHRRVIKGLSEADLNLWLRGTVDVLIISYEHATAWRSRLEADIFDFLIMDEAHYLKTKGVQRTTALLGYDCDGKKGLARWARYVWFLTGTPAPNDVADPWSMLKFCKATPLTQGTFRDRYFRKQVGVYSTRYILREEMLDEYKMVWQSCAIRRTKKQAGLQMPPIWGSTTTIDGDTAEIRDLLRAHPGLEDAIVKAVEKGGLSFLDAPHVMTLRRLVGEAKAPGFTEWLVEKINGGLKSVVVFGIHKRALSHISGGLERAGIGFVRIDGSTSERDREAARRRFQEGDAKVLLGNIRAAGTALTLTRAHDVIMFEQEWTPAANKQAVDRVHRIGQNEHVNVRFIKLAKSIDEAVADSVARKTMELVKAGMFEASV